MPEGHHLGQRATPHAAVAELALRAADRSTVLVGPVTTDEADVGRLIVMAGTGDPILAWIELGESTWSQVAEMGDVLHRHFDSVRTFDTNVGLAEATLAQWPLSTRATQFLADERQRAGGF